jgi:hypothetical protein
VAKFGLEVVHDYNNFRNSGMEGADGTSDCWFSREIGAGFAYELNNAGHTPEFIHYDTNCWEIDFRDPVAGGGGEDYKYVDNVSVVLFVGHGNRENDGHGYLAFNTKFNDRFSRSRTWRLGDRCACDWLMVYGCALIDKNNILPYANTFHGLHEICGGWDTMYGWYTTDECGEDVAEDLIDGCTVADSWIDGVSDWKLDNHPIVISAETSNAYDNQSGTVIWTETTMNNDHFWGYGLTVNEIKHEDVFMLSYIWAEG